jgi:murein DD-endopeptidase MepM/ murein hydrolase activator NlpD
MTKQKRKLTDKDFWSNLKSQIRHPYRLVVMNDDTLEERAAFIFTPLNFFVFTGAVVLFLIVSVIYLIAFTSLREYIPGYADVGMRKKIIYLANKTDSLEKVIGEKDFYLENIANILTGKETDLGIERVKKDSIKKSVKIEDKHVPEDSMLRAQIEQEEKNNLKGGLMKEKGGINSLFFFVPLQGKLTSGFEQSTKHFGVDIVGKKNEPIKSTLDGTVILSTWTPDQGYVIQVQHQENILSIYKHNSALLKKEGERVKAGEPIAIIGNSGELSTGPHVHFELWYKGTPVDPTKYMRLK